MRLLTVTLWVLAGLLLVVAIRSSRHFPAAHVDRAKRERARHVHPLSDAAQEGRVGPCWDEVASQLLHIGADRWLGVGCDVEGAPHMGESPECTAIRKRVTACLRYRSMWGPVPVDPTPARPTGDGWRRCYGDAENTPAPLVPTS